MSAPTLPSHSPAVAPRRGAGRPRLLFLSQLLPFPPDGGAMIRTHHVLRLLAGAYDVTALCFYRRRERATPELVRESVEALGRWARVEVFDIPQEHSRPRFVWDHLRSVAGRKSFTLHAYESPAFRRRLRELLARERFDIVHMDSLDLAGYLPLLEGHKVVCVHHNVESQLLERRAATERDRLVARYAAFQAPLYGKLERRWSPRIALNVMVSEDDERELHRRVGAAPSVIVPNGIDTDELQPLASTGAGIVCVGGINGFANRDALHFLAEEILPELRRRMGDVPATWVGRATEAERAEFRSRYGIELTGYVDDIRPHVGPPGCFVVPIRVGGGTRVKILDAWARGKAVVSTSAGAEGLATAEGENILVRDDAAGFAEAVERVLRDGELRARLERGARRTAERRYSWNGIGETLIAAYDRIIATE